MAQPRDYDPYRTPPLWIEPSAPLDHVHDEKHSGDDGEGHEGEDDGLDGWPEGPVCEPAPKLPKSSHESSMKFWNYLIPAVNASPEEIRRWRLAVSLAVVACSINVPLTFGLFPFIPFSGFAYASTVKDIKIGLLEQQIFEAVKSHCIAPTETSKDFFAKRKGELLRRYQNEIGIQYQPVPTCRDLGVREVEVTVQIN
jgi:hypothetical protein